MNDTLYTLQQKANEMLEHVFPESIRRGTWIRNNFTHAVKDMNREELKEVIRKLEPLLRMSTKLL